MTRAYTALLLSLMLALTSHSGAVARAMPDAVGQMVICTGVGETLVYADAEGQPTSAPHLCPDCVVYLVAGGLPAIALVPAPSGQSKAGTTPLQDKVQQQKPDHGFSPRAPPFAI